MNKYINVITCTYQRNTIDRLLLLNHLKSILSKQDNIRWFVIDDNNTEDQKLIDFLPEFATYLFIGPSRDKGHKQRNLAIEYIYDNHLDGLIYNADDDNKYDPNIFTHLRTTQKFSIIPVGNLGPNGVEKAILNDGQLYGWDAGWIERKYPVDMAAFCFDSKLLKRLTKPFWNFNGVGGESEFIDKVIDSTEDIEFLLHDTNRVYVWHNGLLEYL
jgi:hypothetical protein